MNLKSSNTRLRASPIISIKTELVNRVPSKSAKLPTLVDVTVRNTGKTTPIYDGFFSDEIYRYIFMYETTGLNKP